MKLIYFLVITLMLFGCEQRTPNEEIIYQYEKQRMINEEQRDIEDADFSIENLEVIKDFEGKEYARLILKTIIDTVELPDSLLLKACIHVRERGLSQVDELKEIDETMDNLLLDKRTSIFDRVEILKVQIDALDRLNKVKETNMMVKMRIMMAEPFMLSKGTSRAMFAKADIRYTGVDQNKKLLARTYFYLNVDTLESTIHFKPEDIEEFNSWGIFNLQP